VTWEGTGPNTCGGGGTPLGGGGIGGKGGCPGRGWATVDEDDDE